jgi:hypothetical protein
MASNQPGSLHESCQLLAEGGRVLGVQVYLVLPAVHAERHGFIGRTAGQIVLELYFELLHLRPPKYHAPTPGIPCPGRIYCCERPACRVPAGSCGREQLPGHGFPIDAGLESPGQQAQHFRGAGDENERRPGPRRALAKPFRATRSMRRGSSTGTRDIPV